MEKSPRSNCQSWNWNSFSKNDVSPLNPTELLVLCSALAWKHFKNQPTNQADMKKSKKNPFRDLSDGQILLRLFCDCLIRFNCCYKSHVWVLGVQILRGFALKLERSSFLFPAGVLEFYALLLLALSLSAFPLSVGQREKSSFFSVWPTSL